MKKNLVAALAAALTLGAASSAMAAANPFSDVPQDHWAYEAVKELSRHGIIEGYGDTTFNGNKNLTRYEMAQMVARAMASRQPQQSPDRLIIDRLAAEFATELNSLGVRVAELERNSDNVRWMGTAEYTFSETRNDNTNHKIATTNNVLLRLEPTAEVGSHWHVKARLDANMDLSADTGDDGDVELKRVWAEYDADKFMARLGKFAPIDDDTIADTEFSGAEVSYGDKVKFTVGGGRISSQATDDFMSNKDAALNLNVFSQRWRNGYTSAANYLYAGIDYADGDFTAGAHLHRLKTNGFGLKKTGEVTDVANIWKVDMGYRFTKDVALKAFYANNAKSNIVDDAYSVELNLAGAKPQNVGSWGGWVAYRSLGPHAIIKSTYDVIRPGTEGWEVGANYTFAKNAVLTARYGWSEVLSELGRVFPDAQGVKINTAFGRVNFYF